MSDRKYDGLRECAEDFASYLANERRYSVNTVKSYARELRHFIAVVNETIPEITSWDQLDGSDLRLCIRSVAALDGKKDNISSRSRAHLVSTLKSFYKYLAGRGQIPANPMAEIKIPKFTPALPAYLTYEQFEKIARLPDDPGPKDIRDRAMIELIFASGVRVSELVGIRFRDIDFANMEIRILGKGNKERIVPFGGCSLQAIMEWLAVRDTMAGPDCDRLFVNRFGGPITTRSVQTAVRKIGLENSVPVRITPHKLRHSFATEMLAGGADIRIVQEILGHTSLAVTQVYLHLNIDRLKEVYNRSHPLAAKGSG